jgi:hypothetical protein
VATTTPASGRVLLEAKRHTDSPQHVDIMWTSCEYMCKAVRMWSNFLRRSRVCHWVPLDTIAIRTDQSISCFQGTTLVADPGVEVYQYQVSCIDHMGSTVGPYFVGRKHVCRDRSAFLLLNPLQLDVGQRKPTSDLPCGILV